MHTQTHTCAQTLADTTDVIRAIYKLAGNVTISVALSLSHAHTQTHTKHLE